MIKNIFTSIVFCSLLLSSVLANASSKYWTRIQSKTVPATMPMVVQPSEYLIYSLDEASIKNFMFNLKEGYENAQYISLPYPDGTFREFRVWNTPIFADEGNALYPYIVTITGEDVNNPFITTKMSFTDVGFSATIKGDGKTWHVHQYSHDRNGYYLSFFAKNLPTEKIECSVGSKDASIIEALSGGETISLQSPNKFENPKLNEEEENIVTPTTLTHGSTLRTVRLALACNGEWGNMITGGQGTISLVLSRIVEVTQNLNLFFERELAVTLNLIPNNISIVWGDPQTDPYTCINQELPCMLSQNVDQLDLRIGRYSYDLGHVLTTEGGGLAALSSLCNNGNVIKARGASTSYNTIQISVVKHEMGHQFGSSHTFSANTGACDGNGMPDGAYEPGAGNTIMSYSNNCPPNNVPTIADEDYYHVHNLIEMRQFFSELIECGDTLQDMPSAFIPSLSDTYNIPKNTPFELIAPEASLPGSQRSPVYLYTWEQYDQGFGLTEASQGGANTGPTLRSHLPDTSRFREYPPVANIIENNYSTPGYRLSTVARTLKFKYSVRSILNARGTYAITDTFIEIRIDGGSGPFRITSQNTGTENWNPGDTVEIKWDVAGTDGGIVNCHGVSIYLHYPDRSRPDYQIASYVPNTGIFYYIVPDHYAKNAHVKIKGSATIFFDVSKGKVNVNGFNSINPKEFDELLQIFPNPAKDYLNINYDNISNREISVVMYNAIGQRVWQGTMNKEIQIPVANMARGNYILQFSEANSKLNTVKKVALQ